MGELRPLASSARKRATAIVLSIVLAFGLCPASALANDAGRQPDATLMPADGHAGAQVLTLGSPEGDAARHATAAEKQPSTGLTVQSTFGDLCNAKLTYDAVVKEWKSHQRRHNASSASYCSGKWDYSRVLDWSVFSGDCSYALAYLDASDIPYLVIGSRTQPGRVVAIYKYDPNAANNVAVWETSRGMTYLCQDGWLRGTGGSGTMVMYCSTYRISWRQGGGSGNPSLAMVPMDMKQWECVNSSTWRSLQTGKTMGKNAASNAYHSAWNTMCLQYPIARDVTWHTISGDDYISLFSLEWARIAGISDKRYTGGKLWQTPTVTFLGERLVKGVDYSVEHRNNVGTGTASVYIRGKGDYNGTVLRTFNIKRQNTLWAAGSSKTVSYSSVQRSDQVVTAISAGNAVGAVTYQKASGPACLSVYQQSGKVKVKKGTSRGTYTMKVKVKAAGNATYWRGEKTVTVKVTVR